MKQTLLILFAVLAASLTPLLYSATTNLVTYAGGTGDQRFL